MAATLPDILGRIVGTKRADLPRLSGIRGDLERRLADRREFRDFRAALANDLPAIIAEAKKASPSKGVFAGDYNPASIARTYQAGGAAAISVLTDQDYFQGSLSDLEAARAAVNVPVLRKDFTVDELNVLEAAAHGADAILLIAAILHEGELRHYRELAERYGMQALVEVHNAEELARTIGSGASIIGVNNRDLHTFEVHLETSLDLAEKMPTGAIRVAESGIHSHTDVERLAAAGYHAFLVGEHLMKSGHPAYSIQELRG